MPISAITLDLDDTLWPVTPVIVAAEQALRDWILANCPQAVSDWPAARMHALRDDIWARNPDLGHDFSRLRMLAIEEILADYNMPDGSAQAAFDAFFAARNAVQLYPEARSALERLAKHLPIVALTNGNACLRTIGLDHLFHDAVHARDAGMAKPDPAIFHLACERAGAQPSHVLHVGDHPLQDVIGAREAGLQAIWLDRGDHVWPDHAAPAARCSDLSQLVEQVLAAD